MKITLVKRKYTLEYLLVALQGFAGVLDGLIMFLSCGFLVSSFAIEICKMRTSYFLERNRENKSKIS
jgi:hypothetical protein